MSFKRPFAWSVPLLLGVLLLCGVLALPRQAMPEERMKRPVSRIKAPPKVLTKIPGDRLQRPPRSDEIPPAIDELVPEPITMEFWLEWTSCQIHRVHNDGPIEAILSGSVTSSRSIAWSLTNTSEPGEPPMLSFVEDVFGRSGAAFGSSIGLTWEISIDGGAFQPMEVHSGNILSTIFPPGAHTFQVRITGLPQYNQSDGYYRLRLAQNLAPQL
jgi:hypothetical protein